MVPSIRKTNSANSALGLSIMLNGEQSNYKTYYGKDLSLNNYVGFKVRVAICFVVSYIA